MTTPRWEAVDAVFGVAFELTGAERAAYLDGVCEGEPTLRREVESLLARADVPDARLDVPLDPEARQVVRDLARFDDALIGVRLGRDVVVDVVASGGMGTVYLAHRDGDAAQPVALKVVRDGSAGAAFERRFHAEGDVLASLDHPGIARFLDRGTTPDGRAYYVMEFIDGRPITEVCDLRRSDVATRVALLARVADAVAHAHARQVVHRDLKPANVLVDAGGAPRLVDFGIAKLLRAARETRSTAAPGSTRVMTPEYCSPEQARGDVVTTRSDVYSLGVILFELLTGSLPHAFASYAPDFVAMTLQEPAPRPSEACAVVADPVRSGEIATWRGTTPRRLVRALRGDLDNIVAKALQPDPAARYESVDRFADDLRRHLRGEPVAARGERLGYRVRTLLRRHRVISAAAIAAFVTLVVGAVGIGWQARIAHAEAARARAVTELLVDVLGTAAPDPESGRVARVILDRARGSVLRRQDLDPLSRAAALTAIGRLYGKVGAYDAAEATLAGVQHDFEALGVTTSRDALFAAAALAHVHMMEGHHEQALAIFDHVGPAAATVGARRVEWEVAIYRSQALRLLGRKDESLAAAEHAVALARDGAEFSRRDLVAAYNMVVGAEFALGRLDESERVCREGLAILAASGESAPSVEARSLHDLGALRMFRGDPEGARSYVERARELRERMFPDGHPDVAESCYVLGMIEMRLGHWADAEAQIRREIELHERLTPASWFVDDARSRLGESLLRQGRVAEAEPLLRDSHARLRERLGAEHEHVVEAAARVAQLAAVDVSGIR